MPFKDLKENFLSSCKTGHLDAVKELHQQLKLIKVNNNANQIFQHNLVTGLYESIEFKHWDIAQYLIEQNSHELYEGGCLDAEELLYISCSKNEANLTRYLLLENQIKELNINFNASFKFAASNQFMEIIKIFIFEYNIKENNYIKSFLNNLNTYPDQNSKDIAESIKKMFKTKDLTNTLDKELDKNEKQNKTTTKIKI